MSGARDSLSAVSTTLATMRATIAERTAQRDALLAALRKLTEAAHVHIAITDCAERAPSLVEAAQDASAAIAAATVQS